MFITLLLRACGITSNSLPFCPHTEKNITHNDGPSQMNAHIKTIMAHLIAGKRQRTKCILSKFILWQNPVLLQMLCSCNYTDEKEVKMTN